MSGTSLPSQDSNAVQEEKIVGRAGEPDDGEDNVKIPLSRINQSLENQVQIICFDTDDGLQKPSYVEPRSSSGHCSFVEMSAVTQVEERKSHL